MQGSTFPEIENSRKKVLGNDAVAYADWPELIARMLTCCPGSRRKRGRRQHVAACAVHSVSPDADVCQSGGASAEGCNPRGHGTRREGAAVRQRQQTAARALETVANPRLVHGRRARDLALVDVEAKVLADACERFEEVVPYFCLVTRCLAARFVSQRTSLRGQRGYQGGDTQATCARKMFGVRPAAAARDPIAPPRSHSRRESCYERQIMAGTAGSVEAFLAESVATLTRPFTCDGVGLETLSASDRGAVSAACARAPRPRPAADALVSRSRRRSPT